jgi:hypothetical protein
MVVNILQKEVISNGARAKLPKVKKSPARKRAAQLFYDFSALPV